MSGGWWSWGGWGDAREVPAAVTGRAFPFEPFQSRVVSQPAQ